MHMCICVYLHLSFLSLFPVALSWCSSLCLDLRRVLCVSRDVAGVAIYKFPSYQFITESSCVAVIQKTSKPGFKYKDCILSHDFTRFQL